MKALVKTGYGPNQVSLEERPVPAIAHDQVLVKIEYSAIGSADLRIVDGNHAHIPPLIMGRMFSGRIHALGSEVEGWAVGDPVVAEEHAVVCGKCAYCLSGRRHFCPDKRIFGVEVDGGFAEYLNVPAWLLHRVPDGVLLRDASILECAAVSMYGVVQRTGVEPGGVAVLLGCDAHALLTLQLLRIMGIGKVIVAGRPQDEEIRIPLACEFGAAEAIGFHRTDPVDVVMDMTQGQGADLVVDFIGTPDTSEQGLAMLRTQGRYCMIGIPEAQDISFSWARMRHRAITLTFHYSSNHASWEQVLGFAADGRLLIDPLITDVFDLSNWKKAFDYARTGEAVKILFKNE